MTLVGAVSELWRYPVSSLAGERLSASFAGLSGFPGDRAFGLVETASGEVAAPEKQQRWRPAATARCRAVADGAATPEISVDSRLWLRADSAAAAEALTAHMGFPVAVRPYASDDPSETLAAPRYERIALHVLTTASMARLRALLPESMIDSRRFRPNIVIDAPEQPGLYPEAAWIGRKLAIGGAVLSIVEPCARCGFTLIEQDELPYDPEILRMLKRSNKGDFGVRCSVDVEGPVAAGDSARLL